MHKEKLLLLHGALGSKIQFEELKKQLDHHFFVHTMDFNGHGTIVSLSYFTIDLFVKDVEDYLVENRIDKIHIFGYSMGGYVALKLALMHPGLVSKIMTLGTKFDWTPEIAAKEIRMLNPEKIEEKVPAFARRLEALHTANNWKEVMRKTAQMMVELGNGNGLTDDELKNIDHEVQVGIGELDEMVTLEESERTAGLLSCGSLKVLDGFRHPIEKVDTAVLSKAIKEFIQD